MKDQVFESQTCFRHSAYPAYFLSTKKQPEPIFINGGFNKNKLDFVGQWHTFSSLYIQMRTLFLLLLVHVSVAAHSQTIDSIYVNLYTDSLKRGTFNYINIDGLLSNGRYLPLDSTHLRFETSDGYFRGNSLWVDPESVKKSICVQVILRSNPSQSRSFCIPVKQLPDGPLKSLDELMQDMEQHRKYKKQSRNSP